MDVTYTPGAAWDIASLTRSPNKTYSRLRGVPEGHPLSEWASHQVHASMERGLALAVEEMLSQIKDHRLY